MEVELLASMYHFALSIARYGVEDCICKTGACTCKGRVRYERYVLDRRGEPGGAGLEANGRYPFREVPFRQWRDQDQMLLPVDGRGGNSLLSCNGNWIDPLFLLLHRCVLA